MRTYANGVCILDAGECRRQLTSAEVGRLIYTDTTLPTVHPVNYRIDGDTILTRVAAGTPLAEPGHHVVVFEVDHFDPVSRVGWFVVVTGYAHPITDRWDVDRLRGLDLNSWIQPQDSSRLLRIECTLITGHRVPTADSIASAVSRNGCAVTGLHPPGNVGRAPSPTGMATASRSGDATTASWRPPPPRRPDESIY